MRRRGTVCVIEKLAFHARTTNTGTGVLRMHNVQAVHGYRSGFVRLRVWAQYGRTLPSQTMNSDGYLHGHFRERQAGHETTGSPRLLYTQLEFLSVKFICNTSHFQFARKMNTHLATGLTLEEASKLLACA